jgi:hypothetical protein
VTADLANNHSAVAMPNEYTRSRPVQHNACGRDVGLEGCLGLLNDKDGVAVVFKDVCDRFPARTVGESPMDKNDILDAPVRNGGQCEDERGGKSNSFHVAPHCNHKTQANKFADRYVNEVHPNASEAVISCGQLRTKVQSRRPLVREAGDEAVARCGLPMTPLLGLICLHAARRPTSTTAWAKACGASCGRL